MLNSSLSRNGQSTLIYILHVSVLSAACWEGQHRHGYEYILCNSATRFTISTRTNRLRRNCELRLLTRQTIKTSQTFILKTIPYHRFTRTGAKTQREWRGDFLATRLFRHLVGRSRYLNSTVLPDLYRHINIKNIIKRRIGVK